MCICFQRRRVRLNANYVANSVRFASIPFTLILQGHIVANHLETQDLVDVSLYTRHTGVRHDDTLESWTEVFPTSQCHQQVEPLVPGYLPPTDARWFLVLVASASTAIV